VRDVPHGVRPTATVTLGGRRPPPDGQGADPKPPRSAARLAGTGAARPTRGSEAE
jgi:hypothetical protein